MSVHIDEVQTSVQVVDQQALLTPAVLEQVVAAVLARLDSRARDEHARGTERDLRSVVEQQRAVGGG